ncbi:serine/threonine-protein kinase [Sedimenticola selenatireducens]|uniref:serine/threonine-protein kinase n=1 Tax=Sedimenticola selenatireducens TaxID=191960 RepID=UPI002AAAECA5|nr:serine/threonine-protein kinase [Sedimenticola selenatireducens]
MNLVTNPPENPAIDDLTRTTIGKFQIRKLLGRGATASVYLAQDPFSNNEVAIKIAHQNIFSEPVNGARFKKMFINEASLAGKLRHPYIVKVFDAGTERDMHYIVMEYVDGHTLKRHTQLENLLPIDDVVEIIFKCCNALEYAFVNGLIHRDIKPANLLTTGGTDIKVTDFGTALLADSDLTQVVDAVGTPSYMSPEQIMGRELSQQADIYSLGVVMYQLLSGKLPFTAENQYDLIQKISNRPPTPLKDVRRDIPGEIVRIVDRCIRKKAADRYDSWADLACDLATVHEQLELTTSIDVSDTRKFNILKTLAFFHDFTDVELWEVLRISKWRRFRGAKTLIDEGKIGGSIFILAAGDARIMKNDAFLGLIETGQCFGEMAYIHGMKKPRSASVVSNSPVTVIKIRTEALQQASIQLQTKFNRVLMRTLADRLEKTSMMASAL